MIKNYKNEGHGTIRKSKMFGAVGVIALSGALMLSSYQSVAADEISATSPTTEVSTAMHELETSASTEEIIAQPETTSIELEEPMQDQEVIFDVEIPAELNDVISTAEQVGVVVEEREPVVYDTQKEAEADYVAQVEAVQEAVEKQTEQANSYKEGLAEYDKKVTEQEEVNKQHEKSLAKYKKQVALNEENLAKNAEMKQVYEATVEAAITPVPEEAKTIPVSSVKIEKVSTKTNTPANQRSYSIPVTKNAYGRAVISIQTQKDLETFLDDSVIDERDCIEFKNTEDLVFPQRVYQVTKWTDWYITPQSTGNIDFNNSTFLIDAHIGMNIRTTGDHSQADGNSQVFKNMIVIGSANAIIEETDDAAVMINSGGRFLFSAVKASNMTFKNMKFYAAHSMSSHLFDLMGSSSIVFDGIQSYGYGTPGMTEELLAKLNKTNSHRIFSEAIQIDAAYPVGAGGIDAIQTQWSRQIWSLDMFDGTGSHDIVITNSLFTNYTGPTGHSIITGTNEVSTYAYGATVGSHGMDAKVAPHFRNITVQNSQFDSTIYNPASKNKVNYPIHFLLYNLTEEEVASLKSINNIFTNIRGTNYSNNGVAGTTTKWNGDSFLAFYESEPIAEPTYLPIVDVEKPEKPKLPELVKPVKPEPVKVSYHLVKVKEKQFTTPPVVPTETPATPAEKPIETPVEEVEKPVNNSETLSTPIEQEVPVVNTKPEQHSVPEAEATQTEDKEVENLSAENSSNPTNKEAETNSVVEAEKTQQPQAEQPTASQSSSSNEPSKKAEVIETKVVEAEAVENDVKNEAKANARPNTSTSTSSNNKVNKKHNYSATAKSKTKATNSNSIIAVVVFALTLIGGGLGFLFWKHFLKK